MAVCYASSAGRLREALASDAVTWDFRGGGVAFEERKCAYTFAAPAAPYHERYILLHECAHLYHMCLAGSVYTTPPWFHEGVADWLAGHVYDPAHGRLTVGVLDGGPAPNFLATGLAALRDSWPSAETIHDTGGSDRGLPLLLVHYLRADPDRARRFGQYRDDLLGLALYNRCLAQSGRVMENRFGPWRGLTEGFHAWARTLGRTFHAADGTWDQEGDTFWTAAPAPPERPARLDVLLAPGEKPGAAPGRMDYPRDAAPPLVGPVARGVAEPSVGALVDFARSPGRGGAGLVLGLAHGPPTPSATVDDSAAGAPGRRTGVRVITIRPAEKAEADGLTLLVQDETALLLDGRALGLPAQRTALPGELAEAMAGGGHRAGLTARIGRDALEVTVRAQAPGSAAPAGFTQSWPLSTAQRGRLLAQPMGLVSSGGTHGLTPFVDP